MSSSKRTFRPKANRASGGHYIALALIILTAIFFRIQFNNVAEYSRADEAFYTGYARAMAESAGGFSTIVNNYLQDSGAWLFPHPARWGFILLTAGWTEMIGRTDTRALASLSTLAGILAVALTYLIGVEFLPRRAAVLAAAFSVTSPLQLAMGRRALQEEVHTCLILLTFWLFVRLLRREEPWTRDSWILFCATLFSLTFTMAIKESTLFVFPAFLITAVILRGWRTLISPITILFAASPLLYIAGFVLLGGTLAQFFQIVHIVQGAGVLENPYVPAYQSGPPHRVLIDFLVLSPLICLIAVAALGRLSGEGEGAARRPTGALAAATVAMILIFCLLPSKNIRNFTMGDPFIRLLAAWGVNDYVARWKEWGSSILVVLAIANAFVELWIFQEIFVNQQVYDPVTHQLLRALRMLPP